MFHIKYYFVILYELVWFNSIDIYVPFVCVYVCVCVYTHTTHVVLIYEDI